MFGMARRHLVLGIALAGIVSGATVTSGASPYAGLETREIKALSNAELEDLMNGAGMGLALPAELNGYPGPMHVLALADELGLSVAQHHATQAAFGSVKATARDLGARIVEAERALDRMFAGKSVDGPSLERATAEIAALRGKLRAAHLAAHLEMKNILTAEQLAAYSKARGYMGSMKHGGHRHGHGHAD